MDVQERTLMEYLQSLPKNKKKPDEPTPELDFPVADVYGFTVLQLYESTAHNKVPTFLTKKTEARSNAEGSWRQCGETETMMHPNRNEVLGTKATFQFFLGQPGTPSCWFVTEYCPEENAENEPVELVGCKLEFVCKDPSRNPPASPASSSSSSCSCSPL